MAVGFSDSEESRHTHRQTVAYGCLVAEGQLKWLRASTPLFFHFFSIFFFVLSFSLLFPVLFASFLFSFFVIFFHCCFCFTGPKKGGNVGGHKRIPGSLPKSHQEPKVLTIPGLCRQCFVDAQFLVAAGQCHDPGGCGAHRAVGETTSGCWGFVPFFCMGC